MLDRLRPRPAPERERPEKERSDRDRDRTSRTSRPAWLDDTDSTQNPTGPAWMEFDAGSGSKGPDGKGHVDQIQAWKAEMKELERLKRKGEGLEGSLGEDKSHAAELQALREYGPRTRSIHCL